jgi:D-glycero-beta-D-manno-heptose-7-phosphate kinase
MPITLPDFSDLHMLVIGDVMIDRYIHGHVTRISPEAPVPVVEQKSIENRAGGSANVAVNLKALGAQVTLLSIGGCDQDFDILNEILSETRIETHIQRLLNRKTTTKTRVMSGNQQLLRIDHEDKHDIDASAEALLEKSFHNMISESQFDGIILQDYNKGMLTERFIKTIIETANGINIPTFVDPKEKNFFAYKNCTLFKPNKKEIRQAVGSLSWDEADFEIRQKLQNQYSVITLGSEGIYINNGHKGQIYPTNQRIIADVCGAGDTVISIISLGYIKGMETEDLAIIANMAGGQVCETPGVVPVKLEKLKKELIQRAKQNNIY